MNLPVARRWPASADLPNARLAPTQRRQSPSALPGDQSLQTCSDDRSLLGNATQPSRFLEEIVVNV